MITIRSRSRYSTVLFLIVGSLVVPGAWGQNLPGETTRARSSLLENAWALQFQVGDNFTLKAFQGLAISVKKHLSSTSALRAGVGLGISIGDDDSVVRELPGDSIRATQQEKSNDQSIDIAAQYLFYPNLDAVVSVFYGAGPLFRFLRNKHEADRSTMYGVTTNDTRSTLEEHAWAVGVAGLVGVEWFATTNISFLGEYAISVEYYSSQSSRTDLNTQGVAGTIENEWSTKRFRVYPLSVKFGLSVYF